MAKIKKLAHPGMDAYIFSCPGCEMEHMIPVSYTPEYAKKCEESRPGWKPTSWSYTGSLDSPTFSPSLLIRYEFDNGKPTKVCHLFVNAGRLQFCGDSTHRLAGQTVEMPDVD